MTNLNVTIFNMLKDALSDLRQFLAAESLLNMMKNVFYFTYSSFRSQDIYDFVLTFWSCSRTA